MAASDNVGLIRVQFACLRTEITPNLATVNRVLTKNLHVVPVRQNQDLFSSGSNLLTPRRYVVRGELRFILFHISNLQSRRGKEAVRLHRYHYPRIRHRMTISFQIATTLQRLLCIGHLYRLSNASSNLPIAHTNID